MIVIPHIVTPSPTVTFGIDSKIDNVCIQELYTCKLLLFVDVTPRGARCDMTSPIQLNFEESHELDEVEALSDDDTRSDVLSSSCSTTSSTKRRLQKILMIQSHYCLPFFCQNISHIMLKWH